MNYFSNKYNSIWPWFLSAMYFNHILMLDWMTFADGLASNNNENHANNLGWIYPKSEVHIRRGKALRIFCTINLESAAVTNSSVYPTFEKDGKIVNVTRANETTISLHLPNENVSDSVYKCFLISNQTKLPSSVPSITNNSLMDNFREAPISKSHSRSMVFNLPSKILIDHIRVSVGEGPPEVQNLTCMSYNWNDLRCSWVLPKNSPPVNHTILFFPLKSATVKPSLCPFVNSATEYERTCTWSAYTVPPYSHEMGNLEIRVTGVNIFDKTEQSFYFDKFKHLILDAPRSLVNLSQTTTSVYLRWHKGDLKGIRVIPLDWVCQVEVRNEFFDRRINFQYRNVTRERISVFYVVNITDLRPNAEYTFTVRMKSPEAPSENRYWSDYSNKLTCRTDPLTNPIFPRTDFSLFEIVKNNESSRAVNIFWKPVTDKDQYDSKLKYKIDLYNIDQAGKKVLVESRVHAVNSDDFTDSYSIGNLSHQFVITSAVSEGSALNTSTNTINVPTAYNRVKPLALFYAIYYDYYNDTGVIEWNWKPPKEQQNIVSYKPFWYWRVPNHFQMRWPESLANLTQHQISIGGSLYTICLTKPIVKTLPQCYISVNTEYSSSGLLQMPIVHSVSHTWNTEWFSKKKSNSTEKYSPNVDSKSVVNVGWKISPNQLQKWFSKLYETRL